MDQAEFVGLLKWYYIIPAENTYVNSYVFLKSALKLTFNKIGKVYVCIGEEPWLFLQRLSVIVKSVTGINKILWIINNSWSKITF